MTHWHFNKLYSIKQKPQQQNTSGSMINSGVKNREFDALPKYN